MSQGAHLLAGPVDNGMSHVAVFAVKTGRLVEVACVVTECPIYPTSSCASLAMGIVLAPELEGCGSIRALALPSLVQRFGIMCPQAQQGLVTTTVMLLACDSCHFAIVCGLGIPGQPMACAMRFSSKRYIISMPWVKLAGGRVRTIWQLRHRDVVGVGRGCHMSPVHLVASCGKCWDMQSIAWHPSPSQARVYVIADNGGNVCIVDACGHRVLGLRTWQEISKQVKPFGRPSSSSHSPEVVSRWHSWLCLPAEPQQSFRLGQITARSSLVLFDQPIVQIPSKFELSLSVVMLSNCIEVTR